MTTTKRMTDPMNEPTKEQIQKLPKWAQQHIEAITIQCDQASRSIKRMTDDQTESPFYLDDWYTTPAIKRFIQSPTGRISVNHAGVHCELFLASKDDGQREFGIEIQYSSIERSRLGICSVGIVPKGTNTIALVHKENMR